MSSRLLVLVLTLTVSAVACGESTPSPPVTPTEPAAEPSVEPSPVAPLPVVAISPEPALPPHTIGTRRPASRSASPVRAIAAGSGFGCALFEGGSVECWGASALAETPSGVFTELVAGDTFACALSGAGRVTCWGETGTFTAPPDEALSELRAARTFACARRADRSLVCFGNADSRRLVVPGGTFTTIALHDPSSCGLREDGHIECWGLDAPALDGDRFTDVAVSAGLSCGLRAGEIVCAGYRASTETPPLGPFASFGPTTSIAGGGGICALRPTGEAACFSFDRIVAPPPPPSGPFASLALARTFACGLRELREPHHASALTAVDCWGIEANVPAGNYTSLALGEGWGCALSEAGRVECFGSVYRGQARPPSGTFTAVAAGSTHTCAIAQGGTLACWGEIAAPPAGTFTALASGDRRSCSIATDERLACWGVPLPVPSGSPGPPTDRVRAVAMAEHVECAVLASGSVECWGANTYGLDVSRVRHATGIAVGTSGLRVLGRTDTCFGYDYAGGSGGGMPAPTWHEVDCLDLGAAVRVGGGSACGLDADGEVHCASLGSSGPSRTLVDRVDGGPFASFDVGPGHGCSIRRDDLELRCWGSSAFGEASPPPGRFAAVSAGGSHTCGIREDGTLACWGSYAGTPL